MFIMAGLWFGFILLFLWIFLSLGYDINVNESKIANFKRNASFDGNSMSVKPIDIDR